MSATMRILSWKSEGLRCPDHEVNFRNDKGVPYSVSLLQMPNGTGKTTTLTLLRAALSGSAARGNWDTEQVRGFRKKGSGQSYGSFEIQLQLNDKRVTIIMNFDFLNGTVLYKTTRGAGQVDGFDPPIDFRRFMDEKFVNFYVFDGELAHNLLDSKHTDAQVVVERLFQINTLNILKTKIEEYWIDQTRDNSATEKRGYSRRKNRVDRLTERLAKLKAEREELQEQHSRLATRLEAREKAYEQEIKKEENRSERLTLAQNVVERKKDQVSRQSLSVLDMMTNPYALSENFAVAIYDLKMGLDRVKLPESAAREFFEELAEEDECVCGRPIDGTIREEIRSRAKHYLGSEDVSMLNSMKTTISEAVGRSRKEPEQELRGKLSELKKLTHEAKSAQNDVDQIQLEAEESDPAIKAVKEEIDELRAKLEEVESKLEKFSNGEDLDDDRTTDIGLVKKKLKKATDDLAEITNTLTLKKKRDVLKVIINQAYEQAKQNITREICLEANQRISTLMPYNSITIDHIDRHLVLKGQAGGSVGEQLSIAYAFLSTLFNRSDHQLPFVVDSPAGPIDLAIRPKIGELVPKLSNQFIAFTISSEREKFVDELEQSSKTPVQFITLFRKGATDIEAKARDLSSSVETVDGFCVEDKTFFYDFQIDSE